MLQILIKRIACTDCRSLAKNIHAIGCKLPIRTGGITFKINNRRSLDKPITPR